MRKISMFNLVSLDGYFAGADGNIDWHVVDDEFNRFAVEVLNGVDTIIFGRVTYQLFESYWPNALDDSATGKEDLVIAKSIDDATKIVFSKSLDKVTWKNSRLMKDIDVAEIKKLKLEPGKDIIIYGSGSIVQQFANLALIDEYWLMVSPVILGNGKPLFKDVKQMKLQIVSTKPFTSDNVLLTYKPA